MAKKDDDHKANNEAQVKAAKQWLADKRAQEAADKAAKEAEKAGKK